MTSHPLTRNGLLAAASAVVFAGLMLNGGLAAEDNEAPLKLTDIQAESGIVMPSIFSDHMVLRRAEKVPVWGKTAPGGTVAVALANKTATVKADENGAWSATLNLADLGASPLEMNVTCGKNKISIKDVLVGEVWFASGQSNMGFPMGSVKNSKAEIAASSNPMLRFFTVPQKTSAQMEWDVEGKWEIASPETTAKFTAVGYYFGLVLQKELKSPVGIVCAAWGGTPVQAWTSAKALITVPELKSSCEGQWAKIENFETEKTAYRAAMRNWLRTEGREDKPAANISQYVDLNAATKDWINVKLPGLVKGAGLPKTGAIWLRKEFDVKGSTNLPSMKLAIDGFYTLYLNGVKVKEVNVDNFEGTGDYLSLYKADLGDAKYVTGKNLLAIRIYQPATADNIHSTLTIGNIALGGEWLAKAEFTLPDPSPAALNAMPKVLKLKSAEQNTGSRLFNSMVHPFIPYAISGVVWYQGESNKPNAWQYQTAFQLLINDWRQQWGQGDFPFYFCQLPNHYDKKPQPAEDECAELRESQAKALCLPNTGMAVTIDLGEADIHPITKKPVGERLAAIALAKTYQKQVPCHAPSFASMEKNGNKLMISFKHAESGLVAKPIPATQDISLAKGITGPLVRNSPDSQLEGFAICGNDRKWVWANAEIVGGKVEVWADSVSNPLAVRYAWAINPTCNLYNGDGLPAAPFRTDDFPAKTLEAKF